MNWRFWRKKPKDPLAEIFNTDINKLPFTSPEVAVETMLREMRSDNGSGGVIKLAGGAGEEVLKRLFEELGIDGGEITVIDIPIRCTDPTHNHPWNQAGEAHE